ncbi:MAG: hypothetical protein ACYDBQ_01170 [Thermoplasmatota archaeon]
MTDALARFATRSKGMWNLHMRESVENVLEKVANEAVPDEALIPYLLDTIRSIEVRVEPYGNAPLRGIVVVPFEDSCLDGVRSPLAIALGGVLRRAYLDAALKNVADRQPG